MGPKGIMLCDDILQKIGRLATPPTPPRQRMPPAPRGRSFQLADGFPESHALATPLVRLVALPHLTVPLNCPRLLPNASSQYHVLVWVFWVT